MRYYQLKSHPAAGTIGMPPRWRLPSIRCAACDDTWGTLGLGAIGVDLTGIPDEARYRWENAVAVAPSEFAQWTMPLRGIAPESVLRPSAGFGRRMGRITGHYGEFAWLGGTSIAIRGDEADFLESHGVDLVGYELDPTREDGFVEPELLPTVRLMPELVPTPVCAACKRRDYRTVETPVFQRSSFADRHIARGYEFTSQIFVSEHFKQLVEARAWAGVVFAEIAVV